MVFEFIVVGFLFLYTICIFKYLNRKYQNSLKKIKANQIIINNDHAEMNKFILSLSNDVESLAKMIRKNLNHDIENIKLCPVCKSNKTEQTGKGNIDNQAIENYWCNDCFTMYTVNII